MKIIITTAILLISTLSFGQNTYLKITKSEAKNDYVSYPPGTDFELKTKEGKIVLKNSDTPVTFDIKTYHKLIVFPDYKEESEIYKLYSGKVELILKENFNRSEYNKKNALVDNKHLKAFKETTKSTIKKGYKNLVFTLSNGIIFRYTDGDYKAELNEEPLYIKGKYLIYSKLGVLKLSFNPKNGKLWWVFE